MGKLKRLNGSIRFQSFEKKTRRTIAEFMYTSQMIAQLPKGFAFVTRTVEQFQLRIVEKRFFQRARHFAQFGLVQNRFVFVEENLRLRIVAVDQRTHERQRRCRSQMVKTTKMLVQTKRSPSSRTKPNGVNIRVDAEGAVRDQRAMGAKMRGANAFFVVDRRQRSITFVVHRLGGLVLVVVVVRAEREEKTRLFA